MGMTWKQSTRRLLRVSYPFKTQRLPADIEHHYLVEIELAGRLRAAPRS